MFQLTFMFIVSYYMHINVYKKYEEGQQNVAYFVMCVLTIAFEQDLFIAL